jgi:hypothetical protein
MRRDESGQVAGIEAVPFGLLTFVVAVLVVANAWAVIDAKVAVSTAAREATRAYVETPAGADPMTRAERAGRAAIQGMGRDPDRLELRAVDTAFGRCETARFEASYRIPAVRLPWLGGVGPGFVATARHAEVVDPYRTGLPAAAAACGRGG